ncbi:hypothetical protein WR25_04399 isoform E [Diploscapter pachys]|nr:hypothetical protein WR25_04399 isoform B [Diploscapter pachys]PAV71749.1 hypothetical protein WR25_04399 isoform D [Diploscapter pachys]PAV71750.1 hypothetical protein WR25_04399 isoform E [Diploscapter pachys]
MATSSCDRNARTCFECLSARDPYCGWCMRSNICSEEESCEKVLPNTGSGWLDFQDTFCPVIKSVVPDKIQITTADYLNVTVDNIEEGQNQTRAAFLLCPSDLLNSSPLSALLQTREGHSRRKGPSKCPHLVAPQSHLYVAVGERRNLSVKIQNLDPAIMEEFRCEFRIGETKHEKPALRSGEDTVVCGEMRFDQAGGDGLLPVAFDVVWMSSEAPKAHVIDNTQKVAVEVYKCERLASDCGTCITLDSAFYDCGWCKSQNSCSRQGECSSQWLNGSHLCANPKILDVTPKKGPFGGRTVLRIKGINLGRRPTDVQRAVQVANVPCEVVTEEYKPAKEIVCVTGKATGTENKGPVVIRLKPDNYSYAAVSGFDFVYVQPAVSRIQPSRGPRSGGTDVTLYGTDLDAGSEVSVRFGDVDCRVIKRTASELTCRTASATTDGPLPLRINFDGSHTRFPISINFEFSSSPRVHTIRPKYVFAAGGMQIDVQRREIGPVCVVENDALMKCESPRLPEGDRQPTHANSPVKASYAFDLDGMVTESDRIDIYTNPSVESFPETRYYRAGDDSLTINGKDLNVAATERDFSVKIGGIDCPLTSVANRVITCIPPSVKPLLPSGTQPEVVVKIGNLNYQVGILSYDSPGMAASLMLLIAVFIILMTCLFVCLFCVYRRKSSTQERKLRHLKLQMDNIEMKVATECKQAFAELQTSLDEYTAELPIGTAPAPFLTYREYCARVLFPNNPHNHPIFQSVQVFPERANAVETALRELHKLLMNKTFMLTMVRTMESNKYFVAKDRVYVGSLLMVVLQEKMGYCTELLKQLLRELIEKTVEKKLQPKILFRRSESVAERMLTAWFTFLMYDHLLKEPGRCLYNLYYSIKQQIEKGPQDGLTMESKYSLSEEKLLRATFDYATLDMFVETDIPGMGNALVKAKRKCIEVKYRALPYSKRPGPSDMDLVWITGRNGGRIILQDIDETSRVEQGGWRKINTLAHYNVHDRAIVALVEKQKPFYEPSFLSDHSSLQSRTSPPMSRAWQSISNSPSKEMDANYKLYHLVKPTEHGPNEGQEKMVTEIYLTRLLMMKGTMQGFINDLLCAIFSCHSPTSPFPAVIKYMFDFMDEQAALHGITDPEVSHAWKSNALPLRFWVNLIKNPHFLFDISKPNTVEGCLSVVAQTLMDACSTHDHQLTKDSPSSKLLFAKDMQEYRKWVDSYYSEIRRLDKIKEEEMASLLERESRQHKNEFEVFSALNELYKYIEQYKEPLMDALESNEHALASRLNIRLQDMLALMSDGDQVTDYESSTLGMGYNSSSRLMARERI